MWSRETTDPSPKAIRAAIDGAGGFPFPSGGSIVPLQNPRGIFFDMIFARSLTERYYPIAAHYRGQADAIPPPQVFISRALQPDPC